MAAMKVARTYFEAKGYLLEDTSASKPYDYVGTKKGGRIFIEVKGTTSLGERVFLTKNEVAHAIANPESSVLFVLFGLEIIEREGKLEATGGEVSVIEPWVPDDSDLVPLSFQYFLPRIASDKDE
jgi:hypothetical protein